MIILQNGLNKDDQTEERAFSLLLAKLMEEHEIDLGSAYHLLSGARSDNVTLRKLNKATAKGLLRRWHRQKRITLINGKVRPCIWDVSKVS